MGDTASQPHFMGVQELQNHLELETLHVRLMNWGRWSRSDSTYARLGYPPGLAYAICRRYGLMIAELDAEHIDEIVRSFHMAGTEKSVRHAFILKVEYVDPEEGKVPHVSQRSEDVRRKLRVPCADSTYYKWLVEAKKAVQAFVEGVK